EKGKRVEVHLKGTSIAHVPPDSAVDGSRSDYRYQEESSGRPWHLWPGARAASPKAKAMAKLRYDQMEVPANQLREQRQTGEESTSGKTDMMKEIQRMVSAARRADGKVRRLHEAKAKREAQWVLFEKKSRADFLEQKRLYENDVRRILDEIEEATQQGVIASAEAQDLAAHGFRPKPQAMSVEEPDAWDSLIHDEANQEQGFLGEALRAARQASAATPQHPARSDGSMAGPAEAARLLAATLAALPPGADFGQLGFPQATPGPPDGTTPGAVPHHQSEATEARVPTTTEQPRPAIKEASKARFSKAFLIFSHVLLISIQDGCLDKGSEWLGVYMHTPHYQMQQLAVRPAERTFLEVTKVLHAHATAPARQIFDTIVPLRPQRLTGFLSVLRFSSAARCTGTGGQAAVVVDLSCVGGGYFACILPKELSHHALMTYAQPLTSCEAEELDFFIGCRSRPWPPCAGVVLSDGDVITGMRKGIGSFAKIQAESLFHAGAYWDYPSNMIRFTYRESVCVLHRNRRYLLPHYHHYDQNIVEYVSRSLRLDPHCTLMCSYPIRDLEVQGDLSTFLIAVAEVPSPLETGLSRDQARDIFVLLDPRPMGIKPHFIHLQYPVVHLPTIVALLGLSTPAAMRVGVRGGDRRGDDIHVRGNTTLHLFAEEKPAASSSDETETSSLPEAGAHDHQGPSSSEGRRADIVLGVDRDLNEEYSVWEGNGADPLPPSSHIDTTLPQGHSWNAGLSEAGSPRAPTDGAVGEVITGDAEPEPAETAQDRRVNALIYVPDYVPEVVEVQVSFPSTPSQFVAAVDGARCQEQASAFPDLFPAVPQPLQELAVFVAGPKWQLDTATVIFDCRAVQAGFFARAVPRYLNRESLLVAAGFRGEDPISVHVDGLFRPLGIDQRTNMKTGQTVQLVHRYADGPDCFDLEDMLSSGRGWDTEASIPGVQSHFNSHFLILSDAGPFTFEVTPSAFVSFKEALARSLSTTEHRLCVKGSVPKIVDSYRFGFWASGVLVATEKLSAIPCPPAASPETRSILILDQRCILRGFTWRIVQEGCIGVQALADTYYGICPHGCVVTFKGAEAETREEEQVPKCPRPLARLMIARIPVLKTMGILTLSTLNLDIRNRTSIPPLLAQGAGADLLDRGKVKALIYGAKVDMWSADSRDDAQRVGSQCLTPVLSLWHAEDDGRVISTRWPNGSSLSVLGFSPSSPFPSGKTLRAPCWVHKLLIEPSTASLGRDSAYERAREATRLLGDSWPFPPYRWPIAFDDGSDSDLPAVMDDEPMTVDVSVYLLSPEYTPEHLPLTVVLPQTVRELTDLIEVCRDPTQKDLFPVLVEVTPQPDPGWGIFLALPVWATHSTAICCDLSLFDGRIFAIVVPETVSSYDLCARAGLAHNAEVDIFLPGEIEPLVPGGLEWKDLDAHSVGGIFNRSHQGIPANELVDSLAKQANRGTHPGACEHMLWTAAQIRAGALDWLWLQVETTTHPGHWPTQIGRSFVDLERFSDCIPFTTEESHRAVGMPAPVSEPAWSANCWGAFACLTVNVQSLTETSDMQAQPEETGFNGKSRYLREQLQDMGVHIAALQEARSPADATFVSASHIRFCAARDAQGNFGCELWFARDIPFATNNGTQAFFHPNDFLVVGNGPRELFVRFSRAGLKILFVCLHAPVGTSKDRDAWWHALSRRICRLSRDALVMLLGDFNTGFHHSLNSRVGDLVWPSSHGAPRDLDKIIDCHDLWIPSTFSQCHYGQHHTWVSPAGTSSARLDYVAIPSSWHVPQKGSRVDTSLDWGQARVDHFGLAVRVLFPISIAKNHQAGRAKLDREQLATEQGRQAINEICRNIPMQPWTSNVHRHYAQIEDFLGRSLMLAFPTKRGSCRSSHFTAATWDLRQRRSWLRKQVNREGVTLRLADAWVALITWRRGLGIRAARALTALRLVACQRRFAGLLAEMRSTKAVLRHSIRQDVAKRVQETAAVAAQTTKADVVSRLRPLLGPPRRRSRQQQALRGICHPNGDPALTLEEAEDLWIGHFAGIEDGTRVDPVQLVNECQAFQCSKDLDALALDTNSVPTRAQLEQSLRHTESNRAIGLDGVPGELLRFAAGTASTALFQLFLKVSMRAAEPIQFKGGALHAVWKGKSSATQCSAHRGILVSSTPGKAFHRVVRQQAVPALRSVATDMQIGGLPKFPVTMASHFVRAFQEGCQNRRCSHGLMFLDLREAFYRVVRPLLTGTSFCDEVVALVAQRINLPSGVMHELHRHLQQESLPAEAGASEWASAQLCEAMHSTWFRFQGSHTVVKTGVGSRPGDNLADVCFSFIFAKVLEAIRSELRGQGCLPSIPWSADMTDNLGEIRATADNRVEVLDATWMDDATFFVACDSAASLPESMASTGSAVLQSCVARALLPNLDKGKTEFIACAVGPGSRKVRRQLFSMPEATIRTSCRLWADASVRLVPTYQHLGGFVHHDGTMSRELRHRASLAWKAFNTRKKKVFAAPNVDPKDKAVLYETLVLTVLLHGAGTWRDLTPQEFSILEQAHFGMTFFMLRPLYTYDEALHLGGAHAVSVLGLPSLKTLLHVARLRQLLSYVRTPVAAFWAMLHWQGSWLAACRSSMQWLWSMTDNGVRHSQWISAWKDWHVMCQERPQAWKGLVRRAQAQAVDIEASEVAKRRHIGLVGRQLRWAGALLPAPYRDEARQQHFCAPCNMCFKTFQAWSVHAFKVHGRTTEGRRIQKGTQCQACLRHFTTHIKLCRHLNQQKECRTLLQTAGYSCHVEPGQGSRKAPDEGKFQAPTLQAQGPRLQAASYDWLGELERPSAEVLDCLALLGVGLEDFPCVEDAVWERVKQAFSCVCLPVRKILATAARWADNLSNGDWQSNIDRSLLLHIAGWVQGADLACWLVPDPAVKLPLWTTFRDAEITLPLLDMSAVCPVQPSTVAGVTPICIGPDKWLSRVVGQDRSVVTFVHQDCLSELREGHLPSFFQGPFEDTVFVISICGLPTWGDLPLPPIRRKHFLPRLTEAIFACDLVRLALRLWLKGIPTTLVFPSRCEFVPQPVSALPFLEPIQSREHCGMRSAGADWDKCSVSPF
ncbi:unnamed protein product, partial [Symbiodinium microadriaticum]